VRGRVRDLDVKSRTLTLDDGQRLSWDRLLLATGSRPRRPDWRGLDAVRSGLLNFVSMQDLDTCEAAARRGQKAIVVGGGLIGIELVECLRWAGLDVTFLIREPWYWPVALSEAESAMVIEHIRRQGLNVVTGEAVTSVETGAQGEVTGVLTEQGTRYECSTLGVSVGVEPAVDWLRSVSTPPRLGRGIVVDAGFRTSLPGVFAAGDCAEVELDGSAPFVEQIWYSAKRQGRLAAHSMLGEPVEYAPPVFFNSSKFFEIEYTTVGRIAPAARAFYFRYPGKDVSLRIAEQGGSVKAFNMLGSRWDHNQFERWIEQRRSLDDCMDRLHQAQFDVEFGRLDLAPARAAYHQWRASNPAPVEVQA
jgi:NADPH-dependent 2,4-dienoyl-CoA reductase/sulfur reductase-like enzyme